MKNLTVTLIFILCLLVSACGDFSQKITASTGLGKASVQENQDIICAMAMIPMFNPTTTFCTEARDSCEARALKKEGFVKLSIDEYCDMGCQSDSCK